MYNQNIASLRCTRHQLTSPQCHYPQRRPAHLVVTARFRWETVWSKVCVHVNWVFIFQPSTVFVHSQFTILLDSTTIKVALLTWFYSAIRCNSQLQYTFELIRRVFACFWSYTSHWWLQQASAPKKINLWLLVPPANQIGDATAKCKSDSQWTDCALNLWDSVILL